MLINVKVLAENNEQSTLDLWQDVLQRYGAEVKTATSISQALVTFNEWHPNIFISELPSSGQTNYIMICAVKEKQEFYQLPAIAMSGSPEQGITVINCGFAIFMQKPVNPNKLAELIAQLLINT